MICRSPIYKSEKKGEGAEIESGLEALAADTMELKSDLRVRTAALYAGLYPHGS